jgi:hypothetical protein
VSHARYQPVLMHHETYLPANLMLMKKLPHTPKATNSLKDIRSSID